MAERHVNIFFAPKAGNPQEFEVRAEPDPVIVNILLDVDTRQPIEVDQVFWHYLPQPPQGSELQPTAPAADQVYMEIKFAPGDTPYPLPSTSNLVIDDPPPVEAESASYGNPGTVPVAPNEPRLDAGQAKPGMPQEVETDEEFEYLVRTYEYTVVLTTAQQVSPLDPAFKIRQRHRRLQQ